MEVWVVVQQISYPHTGPDGQPMLEVTHKVMPFAGGDCKFGAGLEVTGIFESEYAANTLPILLRTVSFFTMPLSR